MTEYLQRERTLAGNQNAVVARGQLSGAIDQAAIATEQLHNSVRPTQWDFRNNAEPLMNQVAAATNACQTETNDSTSVDTQARRETCQRVLDAAPNFKQQFHALAKNLAHIEEVYQQEHATQKQLAAEADHIVW